jgi:hypothetical protein
MAYKRPSPAPITEGGTNATSMATVDGTAYFDGTKVVVTATGTALQVLTSNGAGMVPTYQTPSAGSGMSILGITNQNQISPNQPLSNTGSDAYTAIFGFQRTDVSSANNLTICPVSGTLSNMYVYITQNNSTTNIAVTMMVNGSASAITVTVPATSTGLFSDTTHTAAITAGQSTQLKVQQATTGNIYGSVSLLFS